MQTLTLPFINAYIKIENDKNYMEKFFEREKEIKNWYSKENFKNNLLKILEQIEVRTSNKFSNEQKRIILNNYGTN